MLVLVSAVTFTSCSKESPAGKVSAQNSAKSNAGFVEPGAKAIEDAEQKAQRIVEELPTTDFEAILFCELCSQETKWRYQPMNPPTLGKPWAIGVGGGYFAIILHSDRYNNSTYLATADGRTHIKIMRFSFPSKSGTDYVVLVPESFSNLKRGEYYELRDHMSGIYPFYPQIKY